ncbi:hypothetical protein H0H92_001851 [Tricholoma furcatifolium]|nr:hypothetical protein H0H92_001851 [Tricholoma furcatifolium]
MHLQHILSHPPDHVLFPFLHGLEGENEAQNTFFASSPAFIAAPAPASPCDPASGAGGNSDTNRESQAQAQQHLQAQPKRHIHPQRCARVPNYRGLVWVVCEDDLASEPYRYRRELSLLRRKPSLLPLQTSGEGLGLGMGIMEMGTPVLERDGDGESSGSDFEDEDEDLDDDDEADNMDVVVDGDPDGDPDPEAGVGIALADKENEKHMHPVVQRPAPIPAPIQTIGLGAHQDALSTPESSSTASKSPSASSSMGSASAHEMPAPPTLTSASTSAEPMPVPAPAAQTCDLALLTCTFRPCEILQRVPGSRVSVGPGVADDWEFVPAKVPEGISLRNFGIQVPIYATLSDIVVYSPKGAQSPNARLLVQRLEQAVRRKYAERVRKMSGADPAHQSQDLDLLNYNVYLLDATAADMQAPTGVPSLIMRLCGDGVPSAVGGTNAAANWTTSSSASTNGSAAVNGDPYGTGARGVSNDKANTEVGVGVSTWGVHTDGPDGHVVGMEETEAGMGTGVKAGIEYVDVDAEMEMGMEVDGEGEGAGDVEMDVDLDTEEDEDADEAAEEGRHQRVRNSSQSAPLHAHAHALAHPHPRDPNTVDFAQREKEEMRDLTKASEIISLEPAPSQGRGVAGAKSHAALTPAPAPLSTSASSTIRPRTWNPDVGQVFLGNADDVPPMPETPASPSPPPMLGPGSTPATASGSGSGRFRALSSSTSGSSSSDSYMVGSYADREREREREREEAEAEAEGTPSDPFTYLATNDPAKGFGYDICIECHDLAPFPSPAHLRAAEDHLLALDGMWARRVERRRRREGQNNGKENDSDAEQKRTVASNANAKLPPRPPPNATAVIHLPFPSSPANTQVTANAVMAVVRFLEKWLQPVPEPEPEPEHEPEHESVVEPVQQDNHKERHPPPAPSAGMGVSAATGTTGASGARRWSSIAALMPHFPGFNPLSSSSSPPSTSSSSATATATPASSSTRSTANRLRSFTHSVSRTPQSAPPPPPPPPPPPQNPPPPPRPGPRGLKHLALPEAYLELQVARRRSFFVYTGDLGLLRRMEGRIGEEMVRERERQREMVRERERERERERGRKRAGSVVGENGNATGREEGSGGKRMGLGGWGLPGMGTSTSGVQQHISGWKGLPPPRGAPPTPPTPASASGSQQYQQQQHPHNANGHGHGHGHGMGRPAAKSVSFGHGGAPNPHNVHTTHSIHSPPVVVPSASHTHTHAHANPYAEGRFVSSTLPAIQAQPMQKGLRPRANTSPFLPSFVGDHQSWFNDPRFDGSFPSRVLPFLYLGNLNHAANAFMLHALGITHVVSVGECALIPPPHHVQPHAYHHLHPHGGAQVYHGSLWHEEREGRIKVLDIKGVCDDGIDTLEPQLEPICDWIDRARAEGGQVLVHCRVGVSRSATVTIAYVMKHLGLPLVDAYLIVRSRRLSVLIQPNMRLLYNLCGWEIKLAKERAGGNEEDLRNELARTLSWPYLAKEVHALNEKYLHQ